MLNKKVPLRDRKRRLILSVACAVQGTGRYPDLGPDWGTPLPLLSWSWLEGGGGQKVPLTTPPSPGKGPGTTHWGTPSHPPERTWYQRLRYPSPGEQTDKLYLPVVLRTRAVIIQEH